MSDFDPSRLTTDDQILVLRSLHQGAAAEVLGLKNPGTVREKRDLPRNGNKTYSARDLARWMVKQAGETTPDPELGGESSPALERFREARAALAEYDLQIRQGDLMKRADVHEGLSVAASILRRKVARLRKLFGEDAARILADAVEDMMKAIERLFGERDDSTGKS